MSRTPWLDHWSPPDVPPLVGIDVTDLIERAIPAPDWAHAPGPGWVYAPIYGPVEAVWVNKATAEIRIESAPDAVWADEFAKLPAPEFASSEGCGPVALYGSWRPVGVEAQVDRRVRRVLEPSLLRRVGRRLRHPFARRP